MKPLNALLQGVEKVFKTEKEVSPDENRTLEEMVTSKGYPFEKHEVITSDGYIQQISEYQVQKMNLITKPPLNSQYISSMGY